MSLEERAKRMEDISAARGSGPCDTVDVIRSN